MKATAASEVYGGVKEVQGGRRDTAAVRATPARTSAAAIASAATQLQLSHVGSASISRRSHLASFIFDLTDLKTC